MVLSMACRPATTGKKHREINADAIYFDYNIAGDEENNITSAQQVQYRIGVSQCGGPGLMPNREKCRI